MIKYFCDKCKTKEISLRANTNADGVLVVGNIKYSINITLLSENKTVSDFEHLCSDCKHEILDIAAKEVLE